MATAKIFIAHSEGDQELVAILKQCLMDHLRIPSDEVFVSSDGSILPSEDFPTAIRNALAQATAVLVVLTPNSSRRTWLHFEAGGAFFWPSSYSSKHLVVLRGCGLEPANLPDNLRFQSAKDLRIAQTAKDLLQYLQRCLDLRGILNIKDNQIAKLVNAAKRISTAVSSTNLLQELSVLPLNAPQRNELRQALDLADVKNTVASFDPGLHRYLHAVTTRSLSSVLMLNFISQVTLRRIEGRADILHRSVILSYGLNCEHFPNRTADIDFRYSFTVAQPETRTRNALLRFEGDVADRPLTMAAMKIVPYTFGTYPMQLCTIQRKIRIMGSTQVRISVENFSWAGDQTDISYARYPCKGFSCSLTYLPNHFYDYAWFAQWDDQDSALPRLQDVQVSANGISVSTSAWLLPGEGVALSWYPPFARARHGATGNKTGLSRPRALRQ